VDRLAARVFIYCGPAARLVFLGKKTHPFSSPIATNFLFYFSIPMLLNDYLCLCVNMVLLLFSNFMTNMLTNNLMLYITPPSHYVDATLSICCLFIYLFILTRVDQIKRELRIIVGLILV
jgi:hypothetical protein